MPLVIDLNTFSDNRGSLTVIEKKLPFNVKRVFYIYNVDDSIRGGHRHFKTIQAAICISGECKIYTNNKYIKNTFSLNKPNQCLIIYPEDWHTMYEFSKNAILLVLASENFDPEDYIYTDY